MQIAVDTQHHLIVAHEVTNVGIDRHQLSETELDEIVSYTETSNKRWTHDHSAMVLGITVHDRQTLALRFIGADDDPDYEARRGIAKAKNAARQRRHRAAHATGAKPGRPALEFTQKERLARKRAQDAKRAKEHRARKKAAAEQARACETASRKTPSRDIKNIGSVTELSVTHPFVMIRANAINLDGIDFGKFGIVAICVMRGTDVVAAWHATR